MKTQSLTLIISIIFIISLSFVQCSTKRIIQNTAPFTITQSYYQDWVGGIPGNSGTRVELSVESLGVVVPDSLFFRNKVASIRSKPNEKGALWMAGFKNEASKDRNMTDHLSGEYGNTAPIKTSFPFELESDEAVISYFKEDKKYYYKITGIEKKETIQYPATRPGE